MATSSRRTSVDQTPVHTVVLDWDGTLVPAMWPERPTEFLPGAEQALWRMHRAGLKLVVFSARLSPWDPFTHQLRDEAHVASEVAWVRHMLDKHGLTFVDIWTKPGKPGASVYVDDRAERYHGKTGSWKALTEKILLRLGAEEPLFPAFDQEAA